MRGASRAAATLAPRALAPGGASRIAAPRCSKQRLAGVAAPRGMGQRLAASAAGGDLTADTCPAPPDWPRGRAKLRSWELWEAMGNPRFVCSPMVDQVRPQKLAGIGVLLYFPVGWRRARWSARRR